MTKQQMIKACEIEHDLSILEEAKQQLSLPSCTIRSIVENDYNRTNISFHTISDKFLIILKDSILQAIENSIEDLEKELEEL